MKRNPGLRVIAPYAGLEARLSHPAAVELLRLSDKACLVVHTNLGCAPCRLTGYPIVEGVTSTGGTTIAGHLLTTEFGPDITSVPVVTFAHGATGVAIK